MLIFGFGSALPLAVPCAVLSATFAPAGLSELRYEGFDFLARGTFRVLSVQFSSTDGARRQSDTKGSVSPNALGAGELMTFAWGTIETLYRVQGDRLYLSIGTTNRSNGTLEAFSYEPLVLKFPEKPREYDGATPILATNVGSPTVTTMTSSSGVLALCNEDARRPLLMGFPWASDRPVSTTFPLRINSGRGDMYPLSLPFIDRPIAPGQTDRIAVSLRFGDANATIPQLAGDILDSFRSVYPFELRWTDRRPIVSLIAASANTGWPNNPRGWFHDHTIDVSTTAGVTAFRAKLLAWADNSISIMKKVNAQGMITWDIEGEEFPHPTSYLGDPRLAETLAPELKGVVDEYFRRFRDAGFRVGLTIRPQELVVSKDHATASQAASQKPGATLIEKIEYGRKRWGATLFYIDSNGDAARPLDFKVIRAVAQRFPDVLLIPEHKNTAYYSVSAPYGDLRLGYSSTPQLVSHIYANAFSVINIAGGNSANSYKQLADAVSHGDILMRHGWSDESGTTELRSH